MAQTQNSIAAGAFKPGERIAVPALPVLRIENDIAVVAEKAITSFFPVFLQRKA
jgi:hypothetical protein